ncbi:hypothetical protein ILUMI_10768 [Ignelater luminosus]|uniref:DUF4371 domain-containing protein n=1 Tax=Ignelater luminosus TaxID=2038154 RepID=A0A8K0GEL4_IGNLU|nr:hypothetical protein ILUMI_10768 [Ignelater luminosus]
MANNPSEPLVLQKVTKYRDAPARSSGVSSLEASAAQSQKEAKEVQVPDTNDLLRPVIGSTNLSASHASAVIAEIDFDGNDIGKWPENIDSNIRLLLYSEILKSFNTLIQTLHRANNITLGSIRHRRYHIESIVKEATIVRMVLPHVDKRRKRNKVRQEITAQVKKVKYYSMIFDSTPDIAHKVQTNQVLRFDNQEVRWNLL